MPAADDRRWTGSMPDAYDRWLAPVMFRPYAIELAKRAAALEPARLLEVAAGTGVATKELLEALPHTVVTATDLNPAMVEFGARQAPRARWQQADALDLPFPDAEFDLVVCQFGVMFFPDKPAAFRQARRVLTAEGHLLLTAWDAVQANALAAALVSSLERVFRENPPTFVAAVPHGYSDLAIITADLATAGMKVIVAETLILPGRAESAADFARGLCTGSPLRFALEARGDLDHNTEMIAEDMEAHLGPGPVSGQLAAHVIDAAPIAT